MLHITQDTKQEAEGVDNNYSGFIGGALFSSIGAFAWLNQMNYSPNDFVWVALFKLGGTIVLGIAGGLAGMASKDLYKFLKRKFEKK
jgi:hypothetical protein